MNEEIAQRVEAALRERQPELALHTVVRSLLAEGHSRRELVSALQDYRRQLVSEDRDDDELVLDIMAVLDGWASDTAVRNLLPPPCEAPRASSLG